MKKLFTLCALLVSVLTVSLFTSCGKDNDELILGKWNITKMTDTYSASNTTETETIEIKSWLSLEFKEDGTGILTFDEDLDDGDKSSRKDTETEILKWTLIDDDHLVIYDPEEGGEAMNFTIKELKKSKMHLSWKQTGEDSEEGEEYTWTEEVNIHLSK